MNLRGAAIQWYLVLLILLTLIVPQKVQADFFHYYKIKKILTAVAVAKALTNRRPTLLPVPIPIPIPIQQNEVIRIPASGMKKTIITQGGGQKFQGDLGSILHGSNLGSSLHDLSSLTSSSHGSSSYGSSSYGYPLTSSGGLNALSGNSRLQGLSQLTGLSGLSNANSVRIINADSLLSGNGGSNRFVIGNNGIDSRFAIGNNGIDSRLLFGGGNFGNGLMLGGNRLQGNNQLMASIGSNGQHGDDFFDNYGTDVEQSIVYPNYSRRKRKRFRTKNNMYRKRMSKHDSHLPENQRANRKQPQKVRPSPSTRDSSSGSASLEVGDKWKP